MRDIKFKVLNKSANRISPLSHLDVKTIIDHIKFKHGHMYLEETEWAKFLQYTGLKDKNGVEIYEDDILHYIGTRFEIFSAIRYAGKGKYIDYDVVLPVKFDGNKGFQMYQQGIGYLEIFYQDVEVIGNIHENPKLLESHA